MACASTNCSSWPSLEPNPDIAGIGVIVAFMLSAYFTLTLLTLHYLMDHHNQQRNSVDQAFLAFVVPKALVIQNEELFERWGRALDAAVLFLGDTQVVTSVAILLSGYIQLPCGLSTYHWKTIVNLAWFSALTHLAALTSLRHYFRRRPAMAVWRVLFMAITLVLLASALQPTGYVPEFYGNGYTDTAEEFLDYLSSPAICLFNHHRRAELGRALTSRSDEPQSHSADRDEPPFNLSLILMSLVYLVISYVTRVIRLSQSAAETAERWLRFAPINLMYAGYRSAGRHPSRSKFLARLCKGMMLTCIVMSEAIFEIANSMLWEIFWLAAALIWGTFRLTQHRQQSSLPGENTWGFGQLLALFLSALPLWSLFSSLQEFISRPRGIDTDMTPMRSIEGLGQLDRHSWFNGLVSFLFGTALTLSAGTIYAFAGSTLFAPDTWVGSDALYNATGSVILVYVVAISCSMVVAMIFTSIALMFHFRTISSSKISAWYRRYTADWSSQAIQRARLGTWILSISLLLGIQVVVYLVVFYWAYVPIFWGW